jgi:hypothetical protein
MFKIFYLDEDLVRHVTAIVSNIRLAGMIADLHTRKTGKLHYVLLP